MKTSRIFAALLLSFGIAGAANATVLSFEDIGMEYGLVGWGTGFADQGYAFSANSDVIDVSPDTGDWWSLNINGGHSGKFAALNDFAGPMLITREFGGTFSVADLWINGWGGNSNTSTIQGFLNGALVSSVAVSYSYPWKNVALNFSGIDTLKISGGTFVVDDIVIEAPEPGSFALLGIALAGLLAARRRKA